MTHVCNRRTLPEMRSPCLCAEPLVGRNAAAICSLMRLCAESADLHYQPDRAVPVTREQRRNAGQVKMIAIIFDVGMRRLIAASGEAESGFKAIGVEADETIIVTCEGSFMWSVVKTTELPSTMTPDPTV